jgi:hypothetical protein
VRRRYIFYALVANISSCLLHRQRPRKQKLLFLRKKVHRNCMIRGLLGFICYENAISLSRRVTVASLSVSIRPSALIYGDGATAHKIEEVTRSITYFLILNENKNNVPTKLTRRSFRGNLARRSYPTPVSLCQIRQSFARDFLAASTVGSHRREQDSLQLVSHCAKQHSMAVAHRTSRTGGRPTYLGDSARPSWKEPEENKDLSRKSSAHWISDTERGCCPPDRSERCQ